MKVVYLSPEVAPFSKTGGLADVSGALPHSLKKLDVEVIVITPLYGNVKAGNHPLEKTDIQFEVRIGDKTTAGGVYKGFLPDGKVPVYFLESERYFDRMGLYNYPGTTNDFPDNNERFIFFAKGALEIIERLKIHPDVVHCNDWQTGLVPVYLKTVYAGKECFRNTKSLQTLHNLEYQGCCSKFSMDLAGLDWKLFNLKQLEFYDQLNFLKGGIVFSDAISTVSKTYAEEIQTAECGGGLQGVLKGRSKDLYGIVNGVDCAVWNPETDKYIFANYGITKLAGKQLCKKSLQRKYKLPERDVPVIGMVTRLAQQKGLDLVVAKFHDFMKLDIQFVLLGSGDPKYHEIFQGFAEVFPEKVAVKLTFDEPSAHEIEAGADIFLMPSHYEPCGLNQLYSIRYGTVPVVRSTGGLADTIVDVRSEPVDGGRVNGFLFHEYSADLLFATLVRAIDLFRKKDPWQRLMKNGMAQDWSWERSANEYITLYHKITKSGI